MKMTESEEELNDFKNTVKGCCIIAIRLIGFYVNCDLYPDISE